METTRLFENVFVLHSGHEHSVRFVDACKAFTNFTSGVETQCHLIGKARLTYPRGHIEVDNRLAWLLGRLDDLHGDTAFYVHLKSDRAAIAQSYDTRWEHRHSIVAAYGASIMKTTETTREISRDMVDTLEQNIVHFLKDKSNVITIDMDQPETDFRHFAQRIGAVGDIDAALDSLSQNPVKNPIEKDGADVNVEGPAYQTNIKLQHMAQQLRHARSERRNIAALLENAKAERAKLKQKTKKERRLFLIAMAPWILLFFPIAVPLAFYFLRKKKKKPRIKSHVFDAFETLQQHGPEAGIKQLRSNASAVVGPTQSLFEAYLAKSDDDWLNSTNTWLKATSGLEIQLTTGDAPRYDRIFFPQIPDAPAPVLISVLMPAFKCEDTIELSVRSILNQSWRNLELIVVNDKSPDRTGEILDHLALQDSRLKVLHNSVNVGPYVSKNFALEQATGSIITGHDADDIALPNRLAAQYSHFVGNAEIQAVVGQMVRLDENGLVAYASKLSKMSTDGIRRYAMISTMVRRSVLDQLGYWDSVRFGADSELINRLVAYVGDNFVYADDLTMLCLSSSSSLTNDPVSGISTQTGVSDVRQLYKEAWLNWHDTAQTDHPLKRDLSNAARPFPAPPEMLVPQASIDALRENYGTRK